MQALAAGSVQERPLGLSARERVSAHLQAMYGHSFAYFDPNIWYDEDEMRKQVEQLNGCIILTGQAAPAANRKLREDLFKKFASPGGVAGLKPYGLLTCMIHCVGWEARGQQHVPVCRCWEERLQRDLSPGVGVDGDGAR